MNRKESFNDNIEKIEISTERLFLRSPNVNVCFRIVIAGNVNINKFNLVIDKICKKHPLLNSTIKIDENRKAWFIPNTTQIKVEYFKSEELDNWQSWYEKNDGIPFDFLSGPMVKICVIDNYDKTEIIVLGHHIIGDGFGYFNLVKDILLVLDDKLDITPEITPTNKKTIKGGNLGIFYKLFAHKLNMEWRKNRITFSEKEYYTYFEQYRRKFIPKKYVNSIDEADLDKIIENCKINNITVNDVISSAFSNALIELTDLYPKNQIRIGIVVNTRNEIITKPHYCMGNYITGISVKVKHLPQNSFITNTKKISKIIKKQLSNFNNRYLAVNFLSVLDGDLLESIMYASYGKYLLPLSEKIGRLIGEKRDKKRLGISNLGKHEFNNFEKIKLLDMEFISPTFPANLLSVSMITVNNKMNISLLYNEIDLKDDIVKKIYIKAKELMLNFD